MVTRYAPFRELDLAMRPRVVATPKIPMDAVRTDDAVELRFDLPGYSRADVDVTVDRRVLTLTAERQTGVDASSALVSERPSGTVTRQIRLSDSLDTSAIEAAFSDGVLTVSIPVSASAQPRRVEIAAGSPAPELTVDVDAEAPSEN